MDASMLGMAGSAAIAACSAPSSGPSSSMSPRIAMRRPLAHAAEPWASAPAAASTSSAAAIEAGLALKASSISSKRLAS
jgi:hypothetical protein